MTSKKTAASKRAKLPRTADYARTFFKDWERLSRSGRYDMNRLKEAMLLLIANDGPLGQEWRDHALGGDWDGHRECHVGGDFLLAYKIDDRDRTGIVVFVRAGTHAELFE
jgi:mRNA interferase YafQ